MNSDAFTDPVLNSTNFGITSTSTNGVNYWAPPSPTGADAFTNPELGVTDTATDSSTPPPSSRPYVWKYV